MRHLLPAALLAAALAVVPAPGARAAEAQGDPSKGYVIETGASTASLKAGERGKVVLVLEARNGWHVDPRTPLRIDLAAPAGLRLERTQLRKKDAVVPGAESPRFEAPFTAVAPGAHEVRAKLDFFVCSAEACVKQVRDVAVPVTVK